MELDKVLNSRKSCRHYLSKPVPKEMLQNLVRAASLAPSACNLQLTRYLLLDDPEIIRKLSDRVSYKFSWAPAYVLILYDLRFTAERHAAISSAAMAAENLLLKATELGLSSCPMSGFDKDEIIREILSIPKHVEILLLISLGFADSSFCTEPASHLPIGEIFSFNTYTNFPEINQSDDISKHTVGSVINYRRRICSVYMDRFHLHTFSSGYYEMALDKFLSLVLPEIPRNGNILDVLSYDGYFLKLLFDKREPKQKIYASDYLDGILTFLKKSLPVSCTKIDDRNNFTSLPDESIDSATFIFGLPFTPKPDLLVSNLRKKIKSGGTIYCVLVVESWYRRLSKFLKSLQLYIQGKPVNIYENNPFYKTGPHRHVSTSEAERIFKNCGFSKNKSGVIFKDVGKGIKLSYFLFRKI